MSLGPRGVRGPPAPELSCHAPWMLRSGRALLSLLFAACATPGAGSPSISTPRRLAHDEALSSASGATLVGPSGWWVSQAPGRITLRDPERKITVTLIERPEPDLLQAITAAWSEDRPGPPPTPRDEPDAPPPEGGWERQLWVDYDAPPTPRQVVQAWARRYGPTSYVALIEGDPATLDTREAQLRAALGSLHPPGMAEESLAGARPRALDPAGVALLDHFIADAFAALEVPGAAVAVIAQGQVVYERSFGVRALGAPAPVTPGTLFLLASITKPMTTFMQATLVDAGLFTWDTPVTTLLPNFALGDPVLTRQLAMWHMSCACTGMPRQDLEDLFEYGDFRPEDRLASMRAMRPTTGLGETFQYSNLMVAAGGFAAAHAYAPTRPLGEAYAQVMKARVFEPIGMSATTLDFAAVEAAEHAVPHALALDGRPRPMPLRIEEAVRPIAPAGGVWTNLRDMERYVMTELAFGVAPNGARVVSEANLTARRILRVRSSEHGGYGLGLDVDDDHGLSVLSHDGGALGFGTSMFLLPDQGLGLVVLTNVRNGRGAQQLPFNAVVLRRILEVLFPMAQPRAELELAYARALHRRALAQSGRGVELTPDAAWLAPLQGTYTHPTLGTVTIQGNRFDAGEWQTTFGRRTQDGLTTLVFLDPPFAGSGPQVVEADGQRHLVIDYGDQRYTFQPKP